VYEKGTCGLNFNPKPKPFLKIFDYCFVWKKGFLRLSLENLLGERQRKTTKSVSYFHFSKPSFFSPFFPIHVFERRGF
jgi:hypothetical protein